MTDSPFPLDPFALMAETQKRFGLPEAETRRATEALMPAFWAGLRRNVATPHGLDTLMRAFTPPAFPSGGGASANPWQAAGGWPGADWLSGTNVPGPVGVFLSQVFPNEAIRRAVLDQVAATTGIRQDAINALVPVAATLMMGQMARNLAVGPTRDLLDAFMTGYARGRPRPAPTAVDMMAPFAEAMSAFFTGFTHTGEVRGRTETANVEADKATNEAAGDEAAQSAADDGGQARGETASGSSDAAKGKREHSVFFEDFLAAGRSAQEKQIRAFEQIFETLASGD